MDGQTVGVVFGFAGLLWPAVSVAVQAWIHPESFWGHEEPTQAEGLLMLAIGLLGLAQVIGGVLLQQHLLGKPQFYVLRKIVRLRQLWRAL